MITRFACSDCDDHDVRETTINKADYFNVLISVFSFHILEWKNDIQELFKAKTRRVQLIRCKWHTSFGRLHELIMSYSGEYFGIH